MRATYLWLLSALMTWGVVAGATAARDPLTDVPVAERPAGVSPESARAESARAVAVLGGWDRRRAAAWAADDRRALRALYVTGSSAGQQDLAMLAAYHRRGLTVTSMRRQVLGVEVLASWSGGWLLEVTDRLALARVSRSGATVVLPRSQPQTHTIRLRRLADGWRVSAVYD
jgi:hypothetical protein